MTTANPTTTFRSELVTASSLGTFRECPRRFFHSHRLGRVRISEAPALVFGKLFHELLAAWWSGGLDAAVHLLIDQAAAISETDAAKITAMLRGYNPSPNEYLVAAVEHTFEVPIINPGSGRAMRLYRFGGKVDGLLVHKSTGDRWILEHKTTSEEITGFGPYWQRISIDHQIGCYCVALGAVGAVYDVIRKPNIKLCGKDEFASKASAGAQSPSEAYQARCEKLIRTDSYAWYQFRQVHKTAEDIAEARRDLYQQVRILAMCDREQCWPRNSGACRGLYGMCQYIDVCTGRASIADDALFRWKETMHEELDAKE